MRGFWHFCLQTLTAFWLGLAVFFTFAVGTAFFSEPVFDVFRQAGASDPKHYAGMIAMIVLHRYFLWTHILGLAVLALLLGERYLLGRFRPWPALALTVVLLGLGGVGGFVIQPKLHALHQIKYGPQSPPAEREAAGKQFGALHGISQVVNLGVMGGLLVLCWRVRQPAS